MSGFAEYLSAGTSRRIDCVRRQIETYAEPYRPGAAFYKDFIDDGPVKGAGQCDYLKPTLIIPAARSRYAASSLAPILLTLELRSRSGW